MTQFQSPVSSEERKRRIAGRPLFLWGAAQAGIGMIHAIRRVGVVSDGLIDRRSEVVE